MADRISDIAVFVDYDNLLPLQKQAGILDIVRRALLLLPSDGLTPRTRCSVRLYGGWYEGNQMTRLAQDLAVETQRDFPTIIRTSTANGRNIYFNTTCQLAVAMLEEPGHHLFNTYRRKGKPSNIRVQRADEAGCSDVDCILPLMKKLLRTGACPKFQCSVTSHDLIYRHEQKIVDTMLCCDLLQAGEARVDRVILISGDDDFLPPLRSLSLRGAKAVRYHPKPTYTRAAFPPGGLELLELSL